MNEIGGYLELDQFIDNEYYKDLISLNSGRNALLYLMENRKIHKLYTPFYLCDSISKLLDEHNCPYEYYYINQDFKPKFTKKLNKNEFLFIVNFYGQITNKEIRKYKNKYKNIIVDNTQAFFQKPIKNIDTIYSCRKFFGVPDGSYLSTSCNLIDNLELSKSKNKMNHILGRFEGKGSDYYEDFKKNDEEIDKEPLKQMSKLTKNLLKAIDYENIKKIRTNNFKYLNKKLKNINKLTLKLTKGPFVYPLFIENGEEIRKKLIQNKIFIPTLWSNVLNITEITDIEYNYTKNILPIPCDQRYGKEEMDQIIKILEKNI